MAPGPMKIDKLQIHQQVEGPDFEAQIAELERERDEARASVAALREVAGAFAKSVKLHKTFSDGDRSSSAYFEREELLVDFKLKKKLLAVLKAPNPGAALLERLRCAEVVCREDIRIRATENSLTPGMREVFTKARDAALADWRKFMRSEFGAPKKET